MIVEYLLRKLVVNLTHKKQFYIVKVCAWCPKKKYPKLLMWQTYSHGICKKHFTQLQKKHFKNFANTEKKQFTIDKIIAYLFPRKKAFT